MKRKRNKAGDNDKARIVKESRKIKDIKSKNNIEEN